MHRLYYSVIGVFFKFQLIVCLKKKKKTRAVVWIQVEWLQTCSYKYKLFWVNLVLHLHVQTSDIRGFLCPCWVEVKLLLRKWTVQYSIYLESGTLTIRPNSHMMIDPKTQHTREKTRNPAKIVRNGGPWASSLDIVPPDFSSLESPSEGLEFEANTVYNLVLDCNLAAFLNLKLRGVWERLLPSLIEWKWGMQLQLFGPWNPWISLGEEKEEAIFLLFLLFPMEIW